ncbi:hypothetical protein RJ639_007231 [Escallonia herrerae]|uniref:DUF599 domain-containing protein n=1 Tax=Escallonia herrerae TaxID=1293975 RepID=A0AA88VUP4_9ASTE|nr:hypothetical protein RJ639_007231 [Escallonia herrerae]
MGVFLYLDTILVPLSLFTTIGYHAYLWHHLKNKPSQTTIGMNISKRRLWLQNMEEAKSKCLKSLIIRYNFSCNILLFTAYRSHSLLSFSSDVLTFVCLIMQGDDKKGMLAVQSLRNTLMETVLSASITLLITLALAALTNNSYHGNHLFKSSIFGLQSGKILILKYGSASIFLLSSFLCSSIALGNLMDANFLINAPNSGEFSLASAPEYTQTIFERGFMLATLGNRLLCITFPILLWLFGPVPMAVSSAALVRGLYVLDFAGNFTKAYKKSLS